MRTWVVYPDQEPASPSAAQRERGSGTKYLAYRINTVGSQLFGLEVRIDVVAL